MPNSDALLLDTHVWIWLLQGTGTRLERSPVLKAITRSARSTGVGVSAITVWEVAMLEAKGRLSLAVPIHDWISRALSAPGTTLVPLAPAITVESTRLPGEFHGDPADRILAATARFLNCPIVTADRRILDYAAEGHVLALEV